MHRHVADLIEEQSSALRLLKPTNRLANSAGKRTFFVTKKLCLNQLARDCSHIDGDERASLTLAKIVDSLGHQFLAGAAFTRDQDR